MGRIGLILGSSAYGERGQAVHAAAERHGAVVLQRHNGPSYRLPHRIDHAANLRALIEAGCDRAIGVSSVGSLRDELGVGSFLCPDDFIALHLGLSIYDDVRAHSTPGFDPDWRQRTLEAWRAGGVAEMREGGVYWHAIGPRFETPAEIRLIAAHADVIGMTVAAECIAARELGLPYAAVCMVDNLANGIGQTQLTPEEIESHRDANATLLAEALSRLLPELA